MAACSSRAAGAMCSWKAATAPRNVVARFPSLEAAEACYHSPAYQAALAHAKGAAVRDLVVVEEVG